MLQICINNKDRCLTNGKIYETTFHRDGLVKVVNDNGEKDIFFNRRFEPVPENNLVTELI